MPDLVQPDGGCPVFRGHRNSRGLEVISCRFLNTDAEIARQNSRCSCSLQVPRLSAINAVLLMRRNSSQVLPRQGTLRLRPTHAPDRVSSREHEITGRSGLLFPDSDNNGGATAPPLIFPLDRSSPVIPAQVCSCIPLLRASYSILNCHIMGSLTDG